MGRRRCRQLSWPPVGASRPRRGPRLDRRARRLRGLLLLIAFNLVFTPRFAEIDNIRLQFVQVVPVAIVALGMALVIGTGASTCRSARSWRSPPRCWRCTSGYGPAVAIMIALLGGASVGVVNGVLISRFGIQPIVATLALLVGGRGLALVIAQGRLTEIFDPALSSIGSGRVLGVPYVVLIALGVALLVGVARRAHDVRPLRRRHRRQPEASAPRGLPVRRTLLSVYILSAASRPSPGSSDRSPERDRPVVRRQPHRAQRDHRRGRRRDAAVRRPGADRRHAGRRAADAADRGHADHAQPARLGDPDGPGRDHPRRRLHPAPAERP